MSNLKVKGHQRRRQPRPYERNTDFMSRVRSWLTPSAWWTTSTQDGHGRDSCPSSADSSLNIPGGHQLEQPPTSSNASSIVSSRQSQMEAGPSIGMGTGPSIGMGTGPSSGLESGPSIGMGTGPSSGLEAGPSIGMGTGPGVGMESGPDPMNQSHESEESWVAEASDEEEATIGKPGVRIDSKRQEKTDTRPNYSELTRDLLEPAFHVSESMPRSSTNLFHPVERVANPSAKRSINSNKITSLFSSRLYSTHPLTTSTPQLSPVHEDNIPSPTQAGQPDTSVTTREQPQSQLPLSRPPSRSRPPTPSFNITPFKTTLHTTEDSLSRSPFLSPFYSGRTSFGGAASTQQRIRGKRARTSNSPPTLLTVRHSVRARPAHPPVSMATTQVHSVASQTAKKIMETLECLSSPLTDARRLPMRPPPPRDTTDLHQPAKRRRRADHLGHILSPPPVNPLLTPSHTHTPMIIPNEKTITKEQTNTRTSVLLNSESIKVSRSLPNAPQPAPKSTLTLTPPTTATTFVPSARSTPPTTTFVPSARSTPPTSFVPSARSTLPTSFVPSARSTPPTTFVPSARSTPPTTFVPSASSTPPTSFVPSASSTPQVSLGSIKFTAPTLTQPSPVDQPESPPDAARPIGFKPLFHATQTTTTGGKLRSKRSGVHYSSRRDSDEEESTNPMALPPPVALSVGKGGKLPTFSFATEIKAMPPPTHVVTIATSSTPFSFTSPKAVTVQSSTTTVSSDQSKAAFSFSAPKNCTVTAPIPYAKVSMATPLIVKPPGAVTMTTPPPLKNMSVVDALKRPEFQPLGVRKDALKRPEFQPLGVGKDALKRPEFQPLGVGKVQGHEVVDLTDDDEVPPSTKPLAQATLATKPLAQAPLATKPLAQATLATKPLAQATLATKPLAQATLATKPLAQATLATKPLAQAPLAIKPLPQFLPPADSWSCDTCLVNNKSSDKKCIACGTAKPGEEGLSIPSTTAGGIKLGTGLSIPSTTAGGIKLGAGLSIPSTTAGGIKLGAGLSLPPTTTGGIKLGAALSLPPTTAGGIKLGAGLSIPSTTAGGIKLGAGLSIPSTTAGGIKLGAGLSIPSTTAGGIKLGAGLSIPSTTAGGIKLGAGLSIPSTTAGGIKLGAGLSLPPTTAGGIKLGAGTTGLSIPSTTPGGIKLGAGLSIPSTTAGGIKLGAGTTGLSIPSTTAGGIKLGAGTTGLSIPPTAADGIKLGAGNQLAMNTSTLKQSSSLTKAPESTVPVGVEPLKPLAQFAPAAGSWTCDTCMVNNKPEANNCVACSSPKPGSKEPILGSSGGLKLGVLTGLKVVSQPSKPQETEGKMEGASKVELSGPLAQFAPPPGSWTCDTCMICNKADANQCAACATLKPGAKDNNTSQSSAGGLQLGTAGGLKLGGSIMLGGGTLKQQQVSSGGLQLGSQGSGSGGLQLGSQGSGSGGLQLGLQGSGSGGLQLGSQGSGSGGLQLGSQGSGSGGLQLGSGGGIKIGILPLGFGQKQLQGQAPAQKSSTGDIKAPIAINFGIPQTTVAPTADSGKAAVFNTVNLASSVASTTTTVPTNTFTFALGQKQLSTTAQQKPISFGVGRGLPVPSQTVPFTFSAGREQQPAGGQSSNSKPTFVFSASKDSHSAVGFGAKTTQPSLRFGDQMQAQSLGEKAIGGQGTSRPPLFVSSQQNMFLQQDKQQFVGKGEDAPKLNFGGSAPNLAFGQAPCATIGLTNTAQRFGVPASFAFGQQPQGAGSQMSNSPSSNGFNFNANAGMNFNFTAGNRDAKFVAGTSDPSVSNRIMKKAVRRRRQ